MAFLVRTSASLGGAPARYTEDHLPENAESLQAFRNIGLTSDYSFMPVTDGDIAASVTAAMQADAGLVSFARGAGTIMSTASWFAGPIVRGLAGLGNFAMNAALDYKYYKTAHALAKDPNAFWSDYINNVNDIKEDGITTSFFEQFASASSYAGQGGQARLYQREGLKGGAPVMSEIMGLLYRDFTAMNVGMATGFPSLANAGWVASTGISNGMNYFQEQVGMGEDRESAYRAALGVGLISAATGAVFMGVLPYAHKQIVSKAFNGSVGTVMEQVVSPDKFIGSTLFTGAQASSWIYAEDKLKSWYLGTPTSFDATTFAISFGLGAALGAFSHRKPSVAAQDGILAASGAEAKETAGTLSPKMLAEMSDKMPTKRDFNLNPDMSVEGSAALNLANDGLLTEANVAALTNRLEDTFPNIRLRTKRLVPPRPVKFVDTTKRGKQILVKAPQKKKISKKAKDDIAARARSQEEADIIVDKAETITRGEQIGIFEVEQAIRSM